jgi:GMP synthase-like glutamine amidotransferase
MTDNYQLILPMIITCLGATLLAQFMGGKPLYSTILARTLAKQEAEQAKSQVQPLARILERNTRVLDNGLNHWVIICPIANVVWSKI